MFIGSSSDFYHFTNNKLELIQSLLDKASDANYNLSIELSNGNPDEYSLNELWGAINDIADAVKEVADATEEIDIHAVAEYERSH